MNTILLENPGIVTQAAKHFGSQAITASIDYRIIDENSRVFVDHGNVDTGIDAMTWAKRSQDLGAGEILLNAIDRDGRARGYDIEIINTVADSVDVLMPAGALEFRTILGRASKRQERVQLQLEIFSILLKTLIQMQNVISNQKSRI